MAYLVLARKWRPQRFEDVVGQEHVTTTLRNAIAQQRLAHAFLFSGPRGVGKTTVARLLARALNCAAGPTAEPCGTCASCVEITAGNALDVVEIDGASNTGVDNVRDLNENVRYRPASGRFKIYIIDEVHMLSTAAFNALLKTLEEPPEHVKFIFATTEVQKLPQTVVSRCQRYEFKRIPMAEMLGRLRQIVADERLTADDAALFALAREADGSMRDAQSLLDQVIVFADATIDEAAVRAALGVADRTILHQVTRAILVGDPAACLQALDALHRHGYEVLQFARDLVRQTRNLAVAALFADRSLVSDLPDHEIEETMQQATLRSPDDHQRLFRIAHAGLEEIRRSLMPMVVLEMMLLKMATMPEAAPVEDLVERLEQLERRLGGAPPGGGGAARAATRSAPGATRGTGGAHAGTEPVRPVAGGAGVDLLVPGASRGIPRAPHGATDRVAEDADRGATGGAPVTTDPAPGAGAVTGWRAFLEAARAKISLRMCLGASQLVAETADTLHIGVESEFQQRALLHGENVGLLRELAARAYGGPRRIEVSVVRAPAEEVAARQEAEAVRRRELAAQAHASPTVRAAVEILGGEVTEIRPRRRGGHDDTR